MTIRDKLLDALKTVDSRAKVYGTDQNEHEGHVRAGKVLAALFPDGITVKTDEEFTRFVLFCMLVVKQNRYALNYERGGHRDSIHDLGNYAHILEDYDEVISECPF